MRHLFVVLIAVTLAACASVEYQPFEGNNKVLTGQGGTRVAVEGVDFWANGSPVRPHMLIGVIEAKVGDGAGAENSIRSAVAAEVKRRGGDAAVMLSSSTQFTGIVKAAYADIPTSTRQVKYGVIKYQ